MARKATGWTCQRTMLGIKCRTHNLPGTRKCAKCGKPRPARKRPAHMSALDYDYAYYLALNGGVERCRICNRKPRPGRKLDRDHDHGGSGKPRGLLCNRCNRALPNWVTAEWLHSAGDYLTDTA